MQNFKNHTILFSIILLLASCSTKTTDLSNLLKYDPKIEDNYLDKTDITHYKEWGSYNLHDPSCIKVDDTYYCFSTDAIYWPRGAIRVSDTIHIGNIQIRKSKDLVHWDFLGWAFDSIPAEALAHIDEATNNNRVPNGIWAPYIYKSENEYRLYYSVSVFGAKTSCIGMAVADHPEGPWTNKGIIVKTFRDSPMNAIDPTVVKNEKNGQIWMIYGSFFDGLYCVELNSETGFTKTPGDLGHSVARRADGATKVIEAPEVIYNTSFDKYYLFVSYDPLFTHYNIRVGRSDKPEGPYLDMFGNDMSDTTNNYPILSYAYRFKGHPGWAGVAHCGAINDDGQFYVIHQGRLAPDNFPIVLHVRQIKWTEDGWPLLSPQRYAGLPDLDIKKEDVEGKWEFISLNEIADSVEMWQGQMPWDGWHYDTILFNNSKILELNADGKMTGAIEGDWKLENKTMILQPDGSTLIKAPVFYEWDWENEKPTIVLTGLNSSGRGIWAKKLY